MPVNNKICLDVSKFELSSNKAFVACRMMVKVLANLERLCIKESQLIENLIFNIGRGSLHQYLVISYHFGMFNQRRYEDLKK